jgi:ubiquitin C
MYDSITDIKKKILEEEYIPKDQERLKFSYSSNEIKDKKTLVDDNIIPQPIKPFKLRLHSNYSNDTFGKMICSNFYINILNGKTFSVKYLGSTIEDLRLLIREKENIPLNTYNLYYSGFLLDNKKTILDYSICRESTVHLVFKSRNFYPATKICIETIDNKTISLKVKPNYKIKEIKDLIKGDIGIEQINHSLLFFEGNQLDENTTLEDNKITDESTLFLSILKKMKINIKILGGKTIILNNIYQNYTIEEIKDKIEEKENIPKDKQILTFNDKELENDKILSELGVNNDSTFY